MTYEGSYRPGSWAAATTPNGWLLADLAVTDERIATAWGRLRADAGVDDVLDTLLGQGLATLPGFALVVRGPEVLRIVVRRDAVVTVWAGAEERVVEAGGGSWTDIELPLPVEHIQLRQQSADSDETSTGVPVGLGIAQAVRIDLFATEAADAAAVPPSAPAPSGPDVADGPAAPGPELADDRKPVDAAEPEPEPDPDPEPEPEPSGAPDYSDLFAGTQDRDAFLARLARHAEEAAADEESAEPESPDLASLLEVPGMPDDVREPSAATIAPPSGTTAIWTGDLPELAQPSTTPPADPPHRPAPPAPLASPTPAAPPSGLIDGLPWLTSGSADSPPTPSAPPMASLPVSAPPAAPPPPPAPAPLSTPPPVSTAPPPPPAAPSSAPSPVAPPTSPASLTSPPPPPPPTSGDDESAALTMSRAELLAAMGNHGVVGPSVLAVRCPAGHLTPPEQDRCRVCGEAVALAQPTEVPRPTLGLLRSEAGETVQLDRDVIFGRSPQASASRAASQPNLVKIADPGISRNHLHVALDGWQVLVRDLGSSNGTEIQLPGGEVEKLRSGEDYLIEAGTVLTLAGDVRYTFEVTG